jgi:hypothetical protein
MIKLYFLLAFLLTGYPVSLAFQGMKISSAFIHFSQTAHPLTHPSHRAAFLRVNAVRFHRHLRVKPDDKQEEIQAKWETAVEDETVERIESVKSGIISAICGSLVMAPFALITQKSFYTSDAFSAQWEISHDGLAVMLALFGLVYRYAVRKVA